MSFNIKNKSTFIDGFHFASFYSEILVKNLGEDDFIYLSQEFGGKVLDLVKIKIFIIMSK